MSPPKLVPFSATTVALDRIVSSVAILHNILVMICILKLNLRSKALVINNPIRRKLYIVTIFWMVVTIISVVDILLLSTTLQPLGISCRALMMNRAFAYVLLRCSYWYYNLIWLDIVFSNTTMAYSRFFKKIFNYTLFSIASFMMIFFVWNIFISNGYVISLSPYHSCVINMKPRTAITIAMVEAITNCVIFWLFYRKIAKIKVSNDDDDGEIMYRTRKYLVLIAVATLSTWSFVLFAVITDLAFTMASIDSMINLWCSILFDKRLDKIYRIVFRCIAKKHIIQFQQKQKESKSHQSSSYTINLKGSNNTIQSKEKTINWKQDNNVNNNNNANIENLQNDTWMNKSNIRYIISPKFLGSKTVIIFCAICLFKICIFVVVLIILLINV